MRPSLPGAGRRPGCARLGETYGGYHTSVVYEKHDYQTGKLLVIHSYYAAGDEELRGLTEYEYRGSFGEYREETDAAQTLSF